MTIGQRLIVRGTIRFDEDEYEDGSVYEPPETHQVRNRKTGEITVQPMTKAEQDQLTAQYIADGFLVREDEQQPKAVISELQDENARLNAELEELKARLGVPERLGGKGK